MPPKDPRELTPREFELYVKELLEQEGVGLQDFRAQHLENLGAHDGDYEIDVTARFTALGADFLVLIECKRWSNPVKREQIMVLEQKRQSIGAHKAIAVTTSEFQSGALDFAKEHRIALAEIKDGSLAYGAKSEDGVRANEPWLPPYSTWLIRRSKSGNKTLSRLGSITSPFRQHESQGYLLQELGGPRTT